MTQTIHPITAWLSRLKRNLPNPLQRRPKPLQPLPHPGCIFVCFEENPAVSLHTSPQRVSGLLQSNFYRIEDCLAVGGEKYDIYTPGRRPGGHNMACQISRPIDLFRPENILNGWLRPTHQPNAWVATPDDSNPALTLTWPQPQKIRTVQISFDPDYDHAMESVLYRHPERAVVFCVKHYQVFDNNGRVLVDVDNHHQAMAVHTFSTPVETTSLTIRILETWGAPATLFEVRCYA